MRLCEFNAFLNTLDDAGIFYTLTKVRRDAVMVAIVVPGQRWEIEFLDDGTIDIEKFISDPHMYDARELQTLFEEFSE